MADEVSKLTGEERVDALCATLKEKYGMHLPEEVFLAEEDEDESVKDAVEGKKSRKRKAKAEVEPAEEEKPADDQAHEE